jgi:hypothetical protein
MAILCGCRGRLSGQRDITYIPGQQKYWGCCLERKVWWVLTRSISKDSKACMSCTSTPCPFWHTICRLATSTCSRSKRTQQKKRTTKPLWNLGIISEASNIVPICKIHLKTYGIWLHIMYLCQHVRNVFALLEESSSTSSSSSLDPPSAVDEKKTCGWCWCLVQWGL